MDEDGRHAVDLGCVLARPGRVLNGDTGDKADDFYHRWQDDLKLVRDLGVNAYRFSIGVPRVIPTPDGKPNEKGLDFYERIVDQLLEYGIDPIVTLYLGSAAVSERRSVPGWLAEP